MYNKTQKLRQQKDRTRERPAKRLKQTKDCPKQKQRWKVKHQRHNRRQRPIKGRKQPKYSQRQNKDREREKYVA